MKNLRYALLILFFLWTTGSQDAPLVCDLSELDSFSYYTGFTGAGLCPPPFCGSFENSHDREDKR